MLFFGVLQLDTPTSFPAVWRAGNSGAHTLCASMPRSRCSAVASCSRPEGRHHTHAILLANRAVRLVNPVLHQTRADPWMCHWTARSAPEDSGANGGPTPAVVIMPSTVDNPPGFWPIHQSTVLDPSRAGHGCLVVSDLVDR